MMADPQNASTLYAGTWDSGVIVNRDGGQSWSARNNGLSTLITSSTVWSLTLDPVNHSTIYAGTGIGGFKLSIGP
jgi:hypothetical protein